MPVPKPKSMSSLDNACTVIHNNVLYSVSPEAFVSLPLKGGAKWDSHENGVSVKGAVCTGKKLDDPAQASLLVVGGYSDKPGYTGLQEFVFSTGKWRTLTLPNPPIPPTRNRRGHGAVYNAASDSIVVFSGTQSDDFNAAPGASGETWKIQISEPRRVTAAIPPGDGGAISVHPKLFTWGHGSDVALITNDGTVWLLNSNSEALNSEWRNVGKIKDSLDLASTSNQFAMHHDSNDDSMYLVKFDLGQSPNTPQIIAVPGSGPILDQTVSGWPAYNSTHAPTTTRQGASIAQDENGIIVISGGNDQDPISIFNLKTNSWIDAAQFFESSSKSILDMSSSAGAQPKGLTVSSTFATSIGKPTSTSVEASETAKPADHKDPSANTILGITLGSIGVFLVLLLIALLCLKRRKRRTNQVEGSALNPDEKDTVAFAKNMSPTHYRGHNPQLSNESYSSVAILMGQMSPQKQGGAVRATPASSRSSSSSLHKQFKSKISKPIPQMSTNPMAQAHDDRSTAFDRPRKRNGSRPPDGTRRSSGWNKYWSGGSALQILGYGNKRGTVNSERSSRYSDVLAGNNRARATQDSATVPALNFEHPVEVNTVNSGSPVVSQYVAKVPTEGMAGQIERPVSPLSMTSGYSSGVPESITDLFESHGANKAWGTDRAPGNMYQHHGAGSRVVPHATGVSRQPQLAMAATSSDMSWLNLGDQSRK